MSNGILKKNPIVYNTILLYIMTAVKFILPLAIVASLTRRLNQNSYGIITYFTATMTYFLLLFDFGFNFSATKKILRTGTILMQ